MSDNKKKFLDALFQHRKVNAKKAKTVIILLIIQIALTISMVGVENWTVVLPQLLELLIIFDKLEEED
jgi:hypothetical protein